MHKSLQNLCILGSKLCFFHCLLVLIARNETIILLAFLCFYFMWFTVEKIHFFSFQIKDYSRCLDGAFDIFNSVGCVMAPEIVVFSRMSQQLQTP